MLTDYVIADAIRWAEEYAGEPFHALLCDPPYHLTTITKRFGKKGSAPAKYGKDGAFARASRGFMGQQWDGGEITFQPETWHAFGKLLYPGAFGMAFASSRGYHRLAVAIENSGMILHPAIGWLQAQGMPKATRIDTQVDRQAGKLDEREVVGEKLYWGHNAGTGAGSFSKNSYEGMTGVKRTEPITEPATDLAKAWVGHRYGLQALKPTLEFICVFQKPYEGRPLDCITQTGAGALNIDAARIPSAEPYTINTWDDNAHPFGNGAGNPYTSRQETEGRWPTNFILDAEAAGMLDAQAGIRKSGSRKKSHKVGKTGENGNMPHLIYGEYKARPFQSESDGWQGGASEFFFNVQEQIDEADPVRYCPKASPSERNAGLDGFPKRVSPKMEGADRNTRPNAHNDVSDRFETNPQANIHPTVKPIKLNEYLAKLLLPPDIYAPRRIFVPFAGVASEMIGAGLAGWDEITGIELDSKGQYAKIAQARLDYWLRDKPRQLELLKE